MHCRRGPLHCRKAGFGKELIVRHFLLCKISSFSIVNDEQTPGEYILKSFQFLMTWEVHLWTVVLVLFFSFQIHCQQLNPRLAVNEHVTHLLESPGIFVSLTCFCFTCSLIFQDLSRVLKYSVGEQEKILLSQNDPSFHQY